MTLDEYRTKRDLRRTPEPSGDELRAGVGHRFVVQKHEASRLHYDFRLEHDGVLWSWAVPKGPSLKPGERRLAVRVEDHPLEYRNFEGVIPEDQYGAGTVLVWDRGEWTPEGDPERGLDEGTLSFTLEGEKLRGRWTLARMSGPRSREGTNWLLIKRHDVGNETPPADLLEARPRSVITGRSLEEVARDGGRGPVVAESGVRRAEATGRALRPPDPSEIPGARRGALGRDLPGVELATRVARPPEGGGWLHEVKYDGYRILAALRAGQAELRTRRGNDWTDRFPRARRALEALPVEEALLDGEIVFLQSDGTTSFQALQRALGRGGDRSGLAYIVFDLLHLDGFALEEAQLADRKRALERLLEVAGSGTGGEDGARTGSAGLDSHGNGDASNALSLLRYGPHVRGQGPVFFREACRLALEGVVSKRADAPYRSGRTHDWLKSKCVERQELVVGGFTEPSGARKGFGSLLLGYHRGEEGPLVYAGRVGTGFSRQVLEELGGELKKLERDVSPFEEGEPANRGTRGIHWVEPRLVAEVEFTEWTDDGVLRHPSFQGLREDVDPDAVTREVEVETRDPSEASVNGPDRGTRHRRSSGSSSHAVEMEGVRLTHPDRILYPEQGLTKRRLAEFYRDVGDRILPHVVDRPLTLLRCPRGRGDRCFFQKHSNESVPDVVGTVRIEESGGPARYLTVDSMTGLVALVQIGTLEIHPWGARTDRLDRPDRIVFDLDPGPGVEWSRVVEAARELRDRLGELELRSWVKTTGGTGLHVVLPLVRRNSWPEVKAVTEGIARAMVTDSPDRYVATATKSEREGRIYVDYLRNTRGATAVAPYSSRAREGAPVAVPLRWDELTPGLDPKRYTVDTVPRRLAALDDDPWKGFFSVRQSITKKVKEALEMD